MWSQECFQIHYAFGTKIAVVIVDLIHAAVSMGLFWIVVGVGEGVGGRGVRGKDGGVFKGLGRKRLHQSNLPCLSDIHADIVHFICFSSWNWKNRCLFHSLSWELKIFTKSVFMFSCWSFIGMINLFVAFIIYWCTYYLRKIVWRVFLNYLHNP